MNCICCNKEIKPLEKYSNQDSPDRNCWDNALCDKIYANWGSAYDDHTFIICICDDCIEEKLNNNIISIA